jgi:hypothetical protein
MFKSGDIVQRKVESESLKYIGVVRFQNVPDTVVMEQVVWQREYVTKQWTFHSMDINCYVDPKDLTLLVPAPKQEEIVWADGSPVTDAPPSADPRHPESREGG